MVAIRKIPTKFGKFLIKFYQFFISPFLPASCRFYPCCSQYSYEAISMHGLIKGSLLTIKRLFKCHPFNPGGVDNVPDKFNFYRDKYGTTKN